MTNPSLLSRNSISRIQNGGPKVKKSSDYDKNWFPRVFQVVDYEYPLRFLKIKMADLIC